jgi:hypothetical protein
MTVTFARLESDLEWLYPRLSGSFDNKVRTAGKLVTDCKAEVEKEHPGYWMSDQTKQDYREWLEDADDLVKMRNDFLHNPWVLLLTAGTPESERVYVQSVRRRLTLADIEKEMSDGTFTGTHEYHRWTPEGVRQFTEAIRALIMRGVYLPWPRQVPGDDVALCRRA